MEWTSIISGGATGIALIAFYEIAYRRRARLEKEAAKEKERLAWDAECKIIEERSGIKPGSVVRLKSGGPLMTVTRVIAGGAACALLNESGSGIIKDFPLEALSLVEGTEPESMASKILASERDRLKTAIEKYEKALDKLLKKDSEREFKEGDVVRLKSGGPAMTIESIAPEGNHVCVWFLGKESLRGSFSKASLKHEPSAPPRYGEGSGVENV